MIDLKSLKLLLSNKPGLNWEEQDLLYGSEDKTLWLRIFTVPIQLGNKRTFGLTKNGQWATVWQDKVCVFELEHCLPFAVLLEFNRSDLVSKIKEGLKNIGLPEIVVATFPLDDLVIFGFSDEGNWKLLSEKWIDEGYPLNCEIARKCPPKKIVKVWLERRKKNLFFLE